MSKNKIIAYLPLISLLCLNLSSPDLTVAGGEKPTINFSGKLQDTNGDSYVVENITISGMYKQIPMYKKPNKVTTKPTANITRIDLSEISLITVPEKTVHTFDGRDYIELEITYKDPKKTKERFIIEMHKRIWCDQVNQAGPLEKDLAFDAVESVLLEGYKMAEFAKTKENSKEEPLKESSSNKNVQSVKTENKAKEKSNPAESVKAALKG